MSSWGIPRFDFAVNYAGLSHVGKVRENNEDAWRVDMNLGIFAVADGMGRHAAGEVASRLCLETLLHECNQRSAVDTYERFLSAPSTEARAAVFSTLSGAARTAHETVIAAATSASGRRGMGCTLDAALLLGKRGFLIHAGDGRAYLTRPAATLQLTTDHTLGGSLAARGIHSATMADANPTLTSAIGIERGKPKIDEIFIEFESIDRLLLCTDGVYGAIGSEASLQSLARSGSAENTAFTLINAALDASGHDNATVIIVDVNEKRVERGWDGGLSESDLAYASRCPLLDDLTSEQLRRVLSVAVEERFEAGARVPRFSTSDRVAYVVLEGLATSDAGFTFGPSALLYPESLMRVGRGTELHVAQHDVRTLRVRSDDFREVCQSDPAIGAALYERLARCLAGRS